MQTEYFHDLHLSVQNLFSWKWVLNFFLASDIDINPWKVLTPFKVLILPGENKITNTTFEPNFKQALLNSDQHGKY